ncbi:MAG: hypothetical protein RR636_09935 [Clostridium sp.]|uniref:hypothetical protein n=1 Tax=Clostridium sp. TaxID=1506 RepID=UPI003027C277
MKNTKASNIARGGILIALTLIILYAANFITFNTLFLLGLTSAIIPLAIIISDVKTSILVYAASSILAYFIIPDKTLWLLYTIIFGPYGIVKLFIEKRRNTFIELILKIIYFNAVTFICFILYRQFFMPTINLEISIIMVIIGGNVAFFVFDYVLTVFVNSVKNKRFK